MAQDPSLTRRAKAAFSLSKETTIDRFGRTTDRSTMRWYVSRSGETIGPVDEGQVVQWYQAGMRDAMVRDEAGGPWTPIAQSPFGAGLGLQLAHAPPVGACRTCGAFGTKQVKSSISTGGWVLFFVMLLICLPVALVGLFMRDQYSICAHCGSRAWG